MEKWLVELRRARMVVCVTAAETYWLEVIERSGTTGPGKYSLAWLEFTTHELPRVTEAA